MDEGKLPCKKEPNPHDTFAVAIRKPSLFESVTVGHIP